ncbi:MAG: ATP-binding protein, partial [Bacteroidota bacterium]
IQIELSESMTILWIAEENGLWRYYPNQDSFLQFSTRDGIEIEGFSPSCAFHDENMIFFGGSNGLLMFDFHNIRPYPFTPPLYLKEFRVNNIIQKLDPQPLNYKRQLVLKKRENSLDFKWSIPTYYLPKQARLFYRLIGQGSSWMGKVNDGESIQFLGLIPGEYELEVYGQNANGLPGMKKRIAIKIKPAITDLWWFWVGLIFITALVVGTILQLNNRRKLKNILEKQKVIDMERNRIASELHDDMGTGLATIKFLSEPLLQDNLTEDAKERMDRIHDSSIDLLDSMKNIIWYMQIEGDTLQELSKKLKYLVYQLTEDREINLKINVPEVLPDIQIRNLVSRNIQLVVKEAINNSLNHSECDTIEYHFSFDGKEIKILLKDNGKGYDSKTIKPGNGLFNMKERIEKINGRIKVKSEIGTTIHFTVPIIEN